MCSGTHKLLTNQNLSNLNMFYLASSVEKFVNFMSILKRLFCQHLIHR